MSTELENTDLTSNDAKPVLCEGQTVRLLTSHEEHRGKYFEVVELFGDLIKVTWKNETYYFYESELQVVKSFT